MISKTKCLLIGLTLAFAGGAFAPVHAAEAFKDQENRISELEKRVEELTRLVGNKPAVTPVFSEIAKDKNGNVLLMDMIDAARYCKELGMRLPTVRELALYAQSLGAAGISETRKEGFYLIRGENAENKPDFFHFSHNGYKQPQGDLGNYWIWSSSFNAADLRGVYGLRGSTGEVVDAFRWLKDDTSTVRCVR